MTKGKSFFGRDKDEGETEQKDAPSPAPGEMPVDARDAQRTAGGGKLPIPHGETNPETVGTTEVNPHNEAAAQRPATLPNDAVAGHIAGRPLSKLEELSDTDRIAHLRGWGNEGRTRGHISSADWELFEKIVGEDPEKKKVREAQAEAQRKALSGERERDANTDAARQDARDADPLGKSARDRP